MHGGKTTVINPEYHEKHHYFFSGLSFVRYDQNKFYLRCFVHSRRTVARFVALLTICEENRGSSVFRFVGSGGKKRVQSEMLKRFSCQK